MQMNSKIFFGIIVVFITGVIGIVTMNKNPDKEAPKVGQEQTDKGRDHLKQGEQLKYDGDEPPTSGKHGEPVPKGLYAKEIPDVNSLHNLEHGYIYISYQPSLPKDQLKKLERLFFKPFSNPKFSPAKVIMAPREANASPIVFSSWRRSEKFKSVDEQKMINYYNSNLNNSPENVI
jgi:hypothetical protein